MKKFLTVITAAAIAAVMTACSGGSQQVNGTAAETEPAVHNYTYVDPSGTEYSGTYTGGWESNMPNGEGSFEGNSEYSNITIMGNWSNGQPNGQCRLVEKGDNVLTYNGDLFFGVIQGNGDCKLENSNGGIISTYSGEWKDDSFNGYGERTFYFTAEKAAETGTDHYVYKGGFSDGKCNGEGELTVYYTKENAEKVGADFMVCTGQTKNDDFVEPYRYTLYKNNQIVQEGRVRDGKYISDSDKALNDAIYDGIKDIAGDGFLGGIFDAIAPEFYDRNAE